MARIEVRHWVAAVFLVVTLALGAVIGAAVRGPAHAESVPVYVAASQDGVANQVSFQTGFAPVVGKVVPAVVNISSSRVVRAPRSSRGDLFGQFFNQFPDLRAPRRMRETALGSGVIVSADGFVLTNNHVVENATDIHVTLSNKRDYRARVVGTDPMTDIAVVKIDQRGLPVLPLGDSSKMEVGDFCIAVGNPFGLAQTVTSGIISATGRGGLGIEALEDFIQTDAPINPGNSGGALVNVNGQLIGINTAIVAGGGSESSGDEGGGNAGIGFAIPINMARQVMDQIIRNGKVTRAWLGVLPQEVTPPMAKVFGLGEAHGVILGEVEESSPAAKAGLKTGDILLDLDSKQITDSNAFRIQVGMMQPGTDVKFRMFRGGAQRNVSVKLGTMPAREQQATQREQQAAPAPNSALDGVDVAELTPMIARKVRVQPDTAGVVVTKVDPASPAVGDLRRGDVIVSVNRQPVRNVHEYESALRNLGKSPAVLLVNTEGATHFVTLMAE